MSKKLKTRIVVVDKDPNQDAYGVWEKDVSLILLKVGHRMGWVWTEDSWKSTPYKILSEAKYNKKYPGLKLKRGTYRRVLITTLPDGTEKAEFADDWEYYHG